MARFVTAAALAANLLTGVEAQIKIYQGDDSSDITQRQNRTSDETVEWSSKGADGSDPRSFLNQINDYNPFKGNSNKTEVISDDFVKEFEDIVEENGYLFDDYTVTTEDGYVLNVFRVRRPGLKPKAPVMFFMHGILDSADAWVMNFEEGSPAFIAAARGYDVWCGNSRGSRFSRKHETYDADSFWNRTSKFNFWNFSFQEMAEKDGPAFLDKVLNVTGAKTVTWVGHGQGSTQMFYGLADKTLREYYAPKINLFVALGPLTSLTNIRSEFIKVWAGLQGLVGWITNLFGIWEAFGSGAHLFGQAQCQLIPKLCDISFELLDSYDTKYDHPYSLQVYQGHMPAGGSMRSLGHYGQIYHNDKFALYDFGDQFNLEKYGQTEAPIIDLTTIKEADVPIAMAVGEDDLLATVQDAQWAGLKINGMNGLWPVVSFEQRPGGHESFLVGKNMTFFNQTIMELAEKYNKGAHEAMFLHKHPGLNPDGTMNLTPY